MIRKCIHDSMRDNILFAGFIATLFYPAFMEGAPFPNLAEIETAAHYFWAILGIVYMLFNSNWIQRDSINITACAFAVVIIVSSALNGADIRLGCIYALQFVLTVVIVRTQWGKDRNALVDITSCVLGVYIIINLLTSIIQIYIYDGAFVIRSASTGTRTGDMWYLGHKNAIRNYIIPWIACCVLSERKSKELISIISILVGIITLVLVNSLTSEIAVLTCVVVGILWKQSGRLRVRSSYLAVSVLICLATVVILALVPQLAEIFAAIVGKDATFNGRTLLWKEGIERAALHPIFGYGMRESFALPLGDQVFSHPHNALIHYWLLFGLSGLALLVRLIAQGYLMLNEQVGDSAIYRALALTAFLICGLFGELLNPGFWFVLALALGQDKTCRYTGKHFTQPTRKGAGKCALQ